MSGLAWSQVSTLGATLSSVAIEKGLRELNPDIHFDMPNQIESSHFLVQGVPHFERVNSNRQGIYWHGHYIAGMDRGMVTEFKVWEEEDGIEEIPASEKDRDDQGCCTYIEILPTDPFYNAALLKAQAKDDSFVLQPDGKVFKWAYFKFTKVRGRIVRVGWRHTFENVAKWGIPGVTRQAIEEKFNVDLSFRPVGPDAGAAFTEE